jgi:predicted nucleotidyltransferase
MSSADFLFTRTVQRVLAATLPSPSKSFFMRELVALANGGKGNAQRQIEKLIEAGVLLEDERRGRQRSIRANTEFFLYPELSSIARKSFALREPLLRALAPFEADIEEAFVFGSIAKGADTARSDIDLAVIGRASLAELSAAMLAVEQELGRPVHLSLYDPDEWRELVAADPVMAQIAQSPKLGLIKHAETA